jgi:serine/threonine-protein kinase
VRDLDARLRTEALAGTLLRHPGIVAVHGYFAEGPGAYVVMEWVNAVTLQQCFAKRMRFEAREAIGVACQLLDALQCAHDKGIWHRNVQPANVLLPESLRIKLLDFGIARIEGAAAAPGRGILGAPGYIAPEQYLGHAVDLRADLFATGVVLYQLLCGVHPFAGKGEDIMFRVCRETPAPPSVVAGEPALQHLDLVCQRAMAKHAQDRYASAQEFRAALLAQQTQAAPKEFAGVERRRRSRAANGAPPSGVLRATQEKAIENSLVQRIGPIGKAMLKQALKQTSDASALVVGLAEQLGSEAEQASFLKEHAALLGDGFAATVPAPTIPLDTQARPTAGAPERNPAAATVPGLSRETLVRAVQLLSVHVGPIAQVLADRAAAEPGIDRTRFLARLAANLPDPVEQERYLQMLA